MTNLFFAMFSTKLCEITRFSQVGAPSHWMERQPLKHSAEISQKPHEIKENLVRKCLNVDATLNKVHKLSPIPQILDTAGLSNSHTYNSKRGNQITGLLTNFNYLNKNLRRYAYKFSNISV